jgi:triosephosphate isomerase
MRKPLIAGNWKMFKLHNEAVETVRELRPLVANATHCDIVIAPVFVHLKTIAERLEGTNIAVAAQDCAPVFEQSANTGEVSAEMLADVGVRYVIIGHSERRQRYCETDESVRNKLSAAIKAGLKPIICVGETLEERESGNAEKTVERQVILALENLTATEAESIIIAYEPVWAIGTGKTATPKQAQEMHAFIRGILRSKHSDRVAERIRILYGGSVKPDNIAELMACDDIDGALVGGASLDAKSFASIVNYI